MTTGSGCGCGKTCEQGNGGEKMFHSLFLFGKIGKIFAIEFTYPFIIASEPKIATFIFHHALNVNVFFDITGKIFAIDSSK